MKKKIIQSLRILPVMFMFLLATPLYAADGDRFLGKTVEDVGLVFEVISEADKTCKVYSSNFNNVSSSSYNITIPSTINGYLVTTIGESAFFECSSLTSITIPGSVTTIGGGAFCGCDSLINIVSMIDEPFYVDFDETTRNTAILHVPVGTQTKYKEKWRFKNIVEMEKFFVDGESFTIKSEEGEDIAIKVINGENWTCQVGQGNGLPACSSSAKHVTIPQIYRGCTISSIADDAFKGCSSLLSVSFPKTISKIGTSLFDDCSSLAAVQWNADAQIPEAALASVAGNPNLLLYVNAKEYAPATIRNVVAGETADKIVLSEADGGNNFYCPKAFTAKEIEFTHNYSMKSGYNTCEGWETLVLPFDVTDIVKDTYTHLVPIKTWRLEMIERPFWIYEQTSDGWQGISAIKANTPYIICMPNNAEIYNDTYNISGNITFKGSNVMVKVSNELNIGKNEQRTLVPNYQNQPVDKSIYALNVNNQWDKYNYTTYLPGSTFISELRPVRPFEAYMTIEGVNAACRAIPIFEEGEATDIVEMERMRNGENEGWYDLQGQKLQGEPKQKGIYIFKGKKVKK